VAAASLVHTVAVCVNSGQRRDAELVGGLDDGSIANAPAFATPGRHDQVEMVHNLGDAAIADQAHAK
jgi:hypothetical protein